MPTIALDWQPGGLSGWQVAGTAIALGLARRGWTVQLPEGVAGAGLDPLEAYQLKPLLSHTGTPDLVLTALGNQLTGARVLPGHRGVPRVGYVFAEDTALTPECRERYAGLTKLLAGSTWCRDLFADNGMPCDLFLQGIDPSLFSPRPTRRIHDWPVIFSGGKLEYRKGQDLALLAFQEILKTHPNALLLTAWYNPWPQTARGLELVHAWRHQRLDVGQVPHYAMAHIYAAADVAIFPNRCEGGTNLVAMECLAMGIPTILSAGHGHADLPALMLPGGPIDAQQAADLGWAGTEGWVHTAPVDLADEIRDALDGRPWGVALGSDWHWDARLDQLDAYLRDLV